MEVSNKVNQEQEYPFNVDLNVQHYVANELYPFLTEWHIKFFNERFRDGITSAKQHQLFNTVVKEMTDKKNSRGEFLVLSSKQK